jgi:hypothetical protein
MNEIKCIIFQNDIDEIMVEYNENKIKQILNEFENYIIIYDTSQEKQVEIQKIINNKILKDFNKIEISNEDLILRFLPLLSNISLDLNKDNDNNIIQDIINNPSLILENTINIIKEIVQEECNLYINTLKNILELPKEQRDKIIKENII